MKIRSKLCRNPKQFHIIIFLVGGDAYKICLGKASNNNFKMCIMNFWNTFEHHEKCSSKG